MDLYTTARAPAINSIRLFWRTYDGRGRLARRDQAWWFTIVFADGKQLSDKLPKNLALECDCIGDAVVAIAEMNGLVISRDQVRDWWPERCVSWITGA